MSYAMIDIAAAGIGLEKQCSGISGLSTWDIYIDRRMCSGNFRLITTIGSYYFVTLYGNSVIWPDA
jgi:hypothetical protein